MSLWLSGAANGGPDPPPFPPKTRRHQNLTHNSFVCKAYTFITHLCTRHGLIQAQNKLNNPACYSLSCSGSLDSTSLSSGN